MQTITREYIENHVASYETRGVKLYCPECPGHNCWYTEDNGLAFCWNCGYKAKCSDKMYNEEERDDEILDIPSIREVYRNAAAFYQNCMGDGQREYLRNRGIDQAAVDGFGLGFCPEGTLGWYTEQRVVESGIATKDGKPTLAGRIVLPYYFQKETVDLRGRAYGIVDPKYKSVRGSSKSRGANYPYNWDNAIERAQKQKYLVITEGELKALVCDLWDIPCVALPGMLSWKKYFQVDPSWTIVCAFDAMRDPEAKLSVDKAIAKIASKVLDLHVATLPLLGEDKMDLDAYILHPHGGAERLARNLKNAVPFPLYKKLRKF